MSISDYLYILDLYFNNIVISIVLLPRTGRIFDLGV